MRGSQRRGTSSLVGFDFQGFGAWTLDWDLNMSLTITLDFMEIDFQTDLPLCVPARGRVLWLLNHTDAKNKFD